MQIHKNGTCRRHKNTHCKCSVWPPLTLEQQQEPPLSLPSLTPVFVLNVEYTHMSLTQQMLVCGGPAGWRLRYAKAQRDWIEEVGKMACRKTSSREMERRVLAALQWIIVESLSDGIMSAPSALRWNDCGREKKNPALTVIDWVPQSTGLKIIDRLGSPGQTKT